MAGFTINTVTVSGNLTRDPELKSLPSGTTVTMLRLAVNERYKDSHSGEWSDRANYFDVTVWGGIGESVARQVGKGDAIAVSGRLRWREWEKDGSKRQAVDIVADCVVPIPRAGRDQGGSSGYESGPPPSQQPVGAAQGALGGGYGSPPADDDIPF